ncbi:MAG: hypothetical protein SV775_04020 [Thermodesulfobacteriota bacterium]|nr:hypothetical protein [Thermodesulfobacteriota bacterium]
MQCERCKSVIPGGEQKELHGQVLCEDCYMDILSPPKVCDPWAVHSARTFLKNGNTDPELTPIQRKILAILQDKGPQEPVNLCERLQIRQTDLERDIAALRHMEKIRGELRVGKKLICLW